MEEMNKINEILALIDVFRFTVKRDEVSSIRSLSDIVGSADKPDQTKSPSSTRTISKTLEVSCLNLSSKLAEKRVVEESDVKPWEKLQQILFERLMIEDYSSCELVTFSVRRDSKLLISPNFELNSLGNQFNPSDGQILRYLYGCYYRLNQLLKNIELVKSEDDSDHKNKLSSSILRAESLILDQVVLYLTEPDLFPDREKRCKGNQQAPLLLNLISSYFSKGDEAHIEMLQKFVNSIGETCKPLGDAAYDAVITPTYARLSQKFVTMAIDDPLLQEWLNVTRVFIQQPELAKKFLEKNTLKKDNSITYQSTLLGFMLSVSHLPRTSQVEITFFNSAAESGESERKFTEIQLGLKLNHLGLELHKIFHNLLKLPQTRNLFLSWIGRCLHTFKDRKKMWSNQVLMSTTTISVNDGFLLNFLTVMLHLSEPFAGPYNLDNITNSNSYTIDKRMLKVDPKYCKWSKMSHEDSPVHFLGLSQETFLISSGEKQDQETNLDIQPNFISECFFGTHQAIYYGFRSVYERLYKLGLTVNDLHHAFSSASTPEAREMLREKVAASMNQFLNLKAGLVPPNRVTMQMHFCIATAAYLNHLVACRSYEEAINSTEFKTITLNILREKKAEKVCLEYIPEMLVENVLDFFLFMKHFTDDALARSCGILEPIMTFIITFMGNSSLLQNPHLRARFAEILECFLPHQHFPPKPPFPGCPEIFDNHPLISEIAPSLVNVFVSIEMTGEGVQFEQKFSYRRPMYVVLEYIWKRPLHRKVLMQLADDAENNIDSARPPLFLRFINLLMNDAIFLLDEALGYMNQLKEAERRRKTEEWRKLNPQQRAHAESSYSHVGRLARFHNVLSLATIGTLAWLTSEIKTIFSHPTLVDRIANMLNYFLEHLVGPKKRNFNVNDKNDYEFKPREVLEKICKIYINLGHSESNKKFKEFCTAVSSDGRSYSENLLPQATDILYKAGMSQLGTEFEKLSQLVHSISVQNQMDEIQMEDIPDTFLDPIMSTLMVDPVLLPSSRIVVDRTTIARHLLSDQTDPFNRSPLSMEDVIPEVELKHQIECFLKERREAQKQKQAAQGNEQGGQS